VAGQIQAACRERGFFYVTGHGVPPGLLGQLAEASADFFALPLADKLEISMERGGRAWRGSSRWEPSSPPGGRTRRRGCTSAPSDGQDLRVFTGTYGDYLLGKVSKVFPQLRRDVLE
jgi:isopenicillin N synthase-like dioxygenase